MPNNLQVGVHPGALNPTTSRLNAPDDNTSHRGNPAATAQQPLRQVKIIAKLGAVIGKAIEARASEVLAINNRQQPLATILEEAKARFGSIGEDLQSLQAESSATAGSHSDTGVSAIAEIAELLCGAFLGGPGVFRRKRLSLERPVPLVFTASWLGVFAAVVCKCAVSAVAIEDLSEGLKPQLAVVVSIEKFIIEMAVSIFDEAQALAKLRNPQRRMAAEERLRSLIQEIVEASRCLTEEALVATCPAQWGSQTTKRENTCPKVQSRLPLYHGTSSKRLKQILEEGYLRAGDDPAYPGDVELSLTTDRTVAEYFACEAALRDADEGADEVKGIVLELDGEGLTASLYDLVADNYDWDRAIECRDSIAPLEHVLIGTERVPTQRLDDWVRLGRMAFMPVSDIDPARLLQLCRFLLRQQVSSAPKWWH